MTDAHAEPPDEELIRRIRYKDDDLPRAQEALTIFYERHKQFVYLAVRRADRVLVGYGLGTDDIVEETFTQVLERGARSFAIPADLDAESATIRTQRWLSTIASNLIKDKLKPRKRVLPIDPRGKNESLFAEEELSGIAKLNLPLRQAVADTLSERDAAIVWFKIRYYDPETCQSQPPQDAMDAFCNEWNLKPATLRKAYERALTALGQALAAMTA